MMQFDINTRRYFADVVSGSIYRYEGTRGFNAAQILNKKEFASFCYLDCAEDLALNHRRCDEGLRITKLALKCDPNNYVAYHQKGTILSILQESELADSAHQKATAIAPHCMDTWKEYGDFCLHEYTSKRWAKEIYRHACELETHDFQIAASLERKLHILGMESERKKVTEIRRDLEVRYSVHEKPKELFN